MTEKVHTFGAHRGLVGVVSLPDGGTPRAGRPAVLILNAGLIHRVGPYRMHVDLARRLAAAGYVVLRFDQSGLGDSEPRHDRLTYPERAVADVQDAMAFLGTKLGEERFVAVGLCSGAMNAHRAIVADERVVGAVLIDGYTYKTLGNRIRHFAPRIFSPTTLQKGLTRRLADLRARLAPAAPPESPAATPSPAPDEAPSGDAIAIFEQDTPPREVVARELAALARRRAHLLFVYTGGGAAGDSYNHQRQFAETFPDPEVLRQTEVAFYPDADHTFTLLRDREAMLGRVVGWMQEKWGSPVPPR